MRKSIFTAVIAGLIVGLQFISVEADVKVKQTTKTSFGGMMGKMISAFSSADEEKMSVSFVKGDLSRIEREDNITIIDLQKEQYITIDPQKETYTVLTFEEMKQQFEKSAEQMKGMPQEQSGKPSQEDESEWEVETDVNRTGKSKEINGMKAEQLILTVTIKQKGVALEDSGGTVITADQWFSQDAEGYDELTEFNQRLIKKMDLPYSAAGIQSSMGMILQRYPQAEKGYKKMYDEMKKIGGIPVKSDVSIEIVPGKKAKAEMEKESEETDMRNMNKMFGKLAEKLGQKKEDKGSFMAIQTETEIIEVSTPTLEQSLFQIPEGYKKK